MSMNKNKIIWIVTLILSIVYIYGGNAIATKDLSIMGDDNAQAVKAKVLSIQNTIEEESYTGAPQEDMTITTIFTCEILGGERKGEEVVVAQIGDIYNSGIERQVSEGNKIIIYNYPSEEHGTEWVFGSHVRFNVIIIFAAAFFVLLIIFGRFKGVCTIISLSFTGMAIFLVYIPSILSGQNIYISTLISCGFITIMTILITNGWSKKALATILGCLFGVFVAACLSLLLDSIMQLTGITDEHSIYLTYLDNDIPINLNAIVFGGVVVGSLGAVMDVAMDISSALNEISKHVEKIQFSKLVRSGITIGRDIMGTMSNTLILAYIGSSLSTVLLITIYASSITELVNREMIIVELMQMLIGSMAILLTIPLTSLVCGMIFVEKLKIPSK